MWVYVGCSCVFVGIGLYMCVYMWGVVVCMDMCGYVCVYMWGVVVFLLV